MHEQTVAIYCICDEILKYFGVKDDPQCKMTTSEVMTFALIASIQFEGNYKKTRIFSLSLRYFPKILSISRLVRRIHKIGNDIWWMVFKVLQMYLRKSNSEYFIVDSMPVKAYANHKSFRAKIFRGKDYHGYTASKKEYFFGIKIHMIIDEDGVPIEFCFTPGSVSDISGFKELTCDIPIGATLIGDKAYTDYSLEDDLLQMAQIRLLPKRKINSKRKHSGSLNFIISKNRNFIETIFSSIASRMPRYIRARTEKGFCLKVLFFIIAYMINKAFPCV